MAQNTRLPPQAYTRETVVHAFNWLQSQSDQVRDMVQTTDDLVSLYLRAQRFGTSSSDSEAPVSSRNFKEDLKSLAQGLKHFESDPGPNRSLDPIDSPPRERRYQQPSASPSAERSAETVLPPLQDGSGSSVLESSPRSNPAPSLEDTLGDQGMKNLRAVMSAFNLTSESEALRLIVATGTRKLLHFLDN